MISEAQTVADAWSETPWSDSQSDHVDAPVGLGLHHPGLTAHLGENPAGTVRHERSGNRDEAEDSEPLLVRGLAPYV